MDEERIKFQIRAFEYMIDRFVEWYRELNKDDVFLNFDKLKIFTLLFLVTTVNVKEEYDGLLNIFNRFVAMPYGPIEADVYNNIDKMQKYELCAKNIIRKHENPVELDDITKNLINDSIKSIKRANPYIITYDAFDIIPIIHKYYSWRYVYQNSEKNNVLIPKGLFYYDTKYFK